MMTNVKAVVSNPAVLFIMIMAIVGFATGEKPWAVGFISAVFWVYCGMQILRNAMEARNPIVKRAKGFVMFKLFVRSLIWGPLTHDILR